MVIKYFFRNFHDPQKLVLWSANLALFCMKNRKQHYYNNNKIWTKAIMFTEHEHSDPIHSLHLWMQINLTIKYKHVSNEFHTSLKYIHDAHVSELH